MTLTGPSLDDVLLDTPGRCAGAQWLCIIDPFGERKRREEGGDRPTRAMPISVDPLGERLISAGAAPEDWLDRRGQWVLNLIIGNVSILENSIPSRKQQDM